MRAGWLRALLAGTVTSGLAIGVATPVPAATWAQQITAETLPRLRVGGSDATGGIGDWALGNGVLCAVVSDPAHEALLGPRGGDLVDLGRCGLAQDQWVSQETLLNMSRDSMLGADWIRAEPHLPDGSVALVTGARSQGLELETRYRLAPEQPDALRVETRVQRLPEATDAPRAFLFGDVILHGRRQLAPFTLHLDPSGTRVLADGSVGFAHPAVDPDDMIQMVAAILPSNLHVLVGGDRQQPGVAYGVRLLDARVRSADGEERPLPSLSINGESFTMQGVFTEPFALGGEHIGWLELAQSVWMDLAPGDILSVTREIRVGARADVASVTDQLWADHPRVVGRVEPGARLHLETPEGIPVTEARPDASGAFSFHAPPGAYRLRVVGPASREQEHELVLGPGGVDLGTLALPPPARVLLPRGRPMRLVFLREGDDRARGLGDDLLGFRVGDRPFRGSQLDDSVSLAGIDADPKSVVLEPGRYRVLATRGPEFELARAELELAPGQASALRIDSPARVLAHPGWLSSDLHVHTEWSDDSSLPVERQLAAFVAEDADVIVCTEHDRVADFGPQIRRLGLRGRLASLVGSEVTSSAHTPEAPFTAGHANVYPLAPRPEASRGGGLRSEGRRLREIIAEARSRPGAPLVQLNHPRAGRPGVRDLNYFTHLSVAGEPFRREAPLSTWPNRVLLEPAPDSGLRDLDFDLLELWNGPSLTKYRAVRADWYSLLLQGEFRPGVANSDSHEGHERVAYPRTYVRVPGSDGTLADWDPQTFVAGLRAGRVYGSSGPLLDVAVVGPDGRRAGLGDLYPGAVGRLEVVVRRASWIPVSTIRVLVDGAVVHEGAIPDDGALRLPLEAVRDAFVTVEVWGEPTADYAAIAPGFRPFAFTNPIFLDADGDGRFSAPGLPPPPLPVLDPQGLD